MISKKALKAFGRKKTLAVAIPLMMAAQVQGFEFYMGDMEGSFDTQISIGSSWRMEDQDAGLIQGIDAAGGTNAENNNDGDLNFENGDTFSQIFKGSHDLQVSYGNYGAFVRGKYWYDAALEGQNDVNGNEYDDSDFNDLAKYTGAEILDAFVYGEFDLLGMPLDVRLGKQVVSWGESTFILGGINQINPIDVSSFRRPGAEIKEGLIPVNMLYTSLGLTENLSAEAFYQLGFQETVISPCGNYFATNDYAPEGCGPVNTAVGDINRQADTVPDGDGQFGVAFRYFSEALDTEFGFYAMNIHSRVPLVNGSKAAFNEAIVLATNPEIDPTNAGTGPNGFVTFNDAVGALMLQGLDQGTAVVSVLAKLTTSAVAFGGTNPSYSISYPEDQQLAGISFATNMGGIALSGEVTHKLDVPFQVNATELLSAVLQADGIYTATYLDTLENGNATFGIPAGNPAAADSLAIGAVGSALGPFGVEAARLADGEYLEGFKTFDVTQVQVTAIQLIDQVLGASRFAIVAEAGYTFAHDFDESDSAINFDGNGDKLDTVTESSWGYRARVIGQYTDVFAGINLSPVLSLSHDVDGVAPAPGGNFIEGQKTIGFTLNAEYLNTYTAAVSYTQYSGGKTFNLGDRDFASFTLGMQF